MDTLSPRASYDNPFTIYALIDPRDNAVRYIGMTKDVYERMKAHMHGELENCSKTAWVRELKEAQLLFIMYSIEKVDTLDYALERETFWIEYYAKQGAPLLNRFAGVCAFASKRKAVIAILNDRPDASFEEIAIASNCTLRTVKKWVERYKPLPSTDELPEVAQSLAASRFVSKEQEVARILQAHPDASIEFVMQAVPCNRRTAEKWIQKLRGANGYHAIGREEV